MSAIDDDGAPLGQPAAPMIDLLGRATDCTGDDCIVGLEGRAPPNVDNDRSQFCPEPDIKGLWRNRKRPSTSIIAPSSHCEWRRTWTEDRLTGRLPCPEDGTFNTSGVLPQALTAHFGDNRLTVHRRSSRS